MSYTKECDKEYKWLFEEQEHLGRNFSQIMNNNEVIILLSLQELRILLL